MLILGWVIFTGVLLVTVPSLVAIPLKQLRRQVSRLDPLEDWPTLNVIFAARNEQTKIEAALRSLLQVEYPALRITAINDRSEDDTGQILQRLAKTDDRLTVVEIDDLPAGWLGKNHALHVGAEASDSDWLLFTDADVHFSPDVLQDTVRYSVARRVDHLCVLPSLSGGGFLERTLTAVFGMVFVLGCPPLLIASRWKLFYTGAGAFNLVRRAAYAASGGHAALRFDVLDDVKLGKSLKQAGFRADLLFAGEEVSVRWQDSAMGVIRGLEKNGFAAVEYSYRRLLAVTLIGLSITVLPVLAAVLAPWPVSAGYAATLVIWHVAFAVLSFQMGLGLLGVPLLLPGMLVLLYTGWRSAAAVRRNNGVLWRGTHYPLSELRKNLYR